MRNIFIIFVVITCFFGSCAKEYNAVLKSSDVNYKYEYAKECFLTGKNLNAITILQDIVIMMKGTEHGEECLYMLAMASFNAKDYETAAEYFKKYYKTYPKGIYAESASFYVGESLYFSTPEPRLDQSCTVQAISAFQEFLEVYTESSRREQVENRLFQLQDKLVLKELYSAQLYFNLGSYFGNCLGGGSNYEACIITAQNALNEYPFCKERETFSLLIMKSKYQLAKHSVEAKQDDRFRDAEDECYGFINEYPESKDRKLAEDYIADCKKHLKEKS